MKESKMPRVDSRVWGSENECPDLPMAGTRKEAMSTGRKVISVCGMLCRWRLKMGGKPPFCSCGGEDKRQDRWAFCMHTQQNITQPRWINKLSSTAQAHQLPQLEEPITL